MARRKWTPEEDEILRSMYPVYYANEIVGHLDRSVSAIHGRAKVLGIECTPMKIERSGRKGAMSERSVQTRFKKGMTSVNKGKHVAPDVYAKMQPTMFRKGNTPANHREVGEERVNVDGYVEVKVAEPRTWKLKHRVIWEAANGAIPKGYNIQFRNGNRQDVRLENLYMISQAEQMRTENGLIAKYPKELADVIRLKGALKRKIKNVRNGR